MMPPLAEVTIPVTGEQVAVWLACLFFLVAGMNQVRRLMGRDKLDQPLRVALEKEFTPIGAHTALKVELDRRMEKAKESREKMHGTLTSHEARLSAIEVTNTHQNQLLQDLKRSIDGTNTRLDLVLTTLKKQNHE
ncbi:hypothetical protein H5P28_00260 [Ruficoccus amylovorans]|uniref:Uncharacterized protein n=1 Tax=Ruficoccus amylovorans TaxID=1804625 RepID=A0A842HAS1_9BACT|nr:hypothetical protein [Ruficoccus amylovorans]MBC2592684.1 hypothetical protein [Ruficoccus amylovorans]